MIIFGIGIDVVEVERISLSLTEFGIRFSNKVFTRLEQDYCESQKHPAIHYAARFAAKEAVAKALGTGIGKQLGWLNVEVSRRSSGEPEVSLRGDGKIFAEANNITQIKISLTHAEHYAAANAIVLCEA